MQRKEGKTKKKGRIWKWERSGSKEDNIEGSKGRNRKLMDYRQFGKALFEENRTR